MWLSVIIPTHNRAGSLKRLLESLDCLEYPDSFQAEVLIIDNGSTDGTGSFLLKEQAKSLEIKEDLKRKTSGPT